MIARRQEKISFWKSQFTTTPTGSQILFDLVFGIVAPILCFVFDPLVFKGGFGFGDGGLFADYGTFAYLSSALAIMFLIMWLLCGSQLKVTANLVGGILLEAAALSAVIGVVISPFSVIGLTFMGVGIFGFTPFLTAFVYLRNAKRTLAAGRNYLAQQPRLAATMGGLLLAIAVPAGLAFTASRFVSDSVNTVLYADSISADLAAERLSYVGFLATSELDKLVSAYAQESELTRKEELKRRYKMITGYDIEARSQLLAD